MEVATIPQGSGMAGPMARFRLRSLPMDDAEVGRRIRAARGYAGLSQAELGNRVDLTEDRVGALEKGERRAHRWELWGIAEVCGVSRSWFTDDWQSGGVSEIEQALAHPESEPEARDEAETQRRPG